MQKRFYIIMVGLSLFESSNARQKESKNEAGRVRGVTHEVVPVLDGSEKEKKINKKQITAAERKKNRDSKAKDLAEKKQEKMHEKKAVQKQEKLKKRKRVHRKKTDIPFKARIHIAHKHRSLAKKAEIQVKRTRHTMHDVKDKQKTIEKIEKKRIARVSEENKRKVLLDARRAETEKDQKIKDYISCRTHGTCEHPALHKLRKQHHALSYQLKNHHKVRRNELKAYAFHYEKAGLDEVHKKEKKKHSELEVVHGKSNKRTRKNLNETPDQLDRKRGIEERRKHHADLHQKIKKPRRHSAKRDRNARHNDLEQQEKSTKKLKVVVQK